MTDEFKIVTYFTNWATYRPGKGSYSPANIDPTLCTHIIYAFSLLDPNTFLLKPSDTWVDFDKHFYQEVTNLKSKNVKVLLAIGGWNDSAGNKYSQLVTDPTHRRGFIEHVVVFLQQNNFDGLDLDWEYPARPQGGHGNPADKKNFTLFVQELRSAFDKISPPLLLTAAVSANKDIIKDAYDVPALSCCLDFFNVMCYDYHGNWDKKTGPVAPFRAYPGADPNLTVEATLNYYIESGAPPKKLVMGIPAYGQTFTLANAQDHGLNAPSTGAGEAGEFTRQAGVLAFYEIKEKIENQGWTKVPDPAFTSGPYAFKGNQWVGFDDPATILQKALYVRKKNYGGCMMWDLSMDDFNANPTYPIVRAIKKGLTGDE